jgi:hypothetical protein
MLGNAAGTAAKAALRLQAARQPGDYVLLVCVWNGLPWTAKPRSPGCGILHISWVYPLLSTWPFTCVLFVYNASTLLIACANAIHLV